LDVEALKLQDTGMNSSLPVEVIRALRLAYYCSVSYIDDLVGRNISELKSQKLLDSTVIAFMGDHGWHLGEKNMWGKHTNFELATRAPLMIKIPGLTDAPSTERGLFYDKPVEFVDLFPSLVEAAGFPPLSVCPKYSRNVALCTEGASLLSLIPPSRQFSKFLSESIVHAPGQPDNAPRHNRTIAYSQYPCRGFFIMGTQYERSGSATRSGSEGSVSGTLPRRTVTCTPWSCTITQTTLTRRGTQPAIKRAPVFSWN